MGGDDLEVKREMVSDAGGVRIWHILNKARLSNRQILVEINIFCRKLEPRGGWTDDAVGPVRNWPTFSPEPRERRSN